jgi:hypothetical protein
MVKPVRTPESDRVRGYRRDVEGDSGKHPLSVNSRSVTSVVGDSTMPMETHIDCTPSRQPKGRQRNYPGMLSSPCNVTVTRRRASPERMHDAAKYSPEVGGYGWGSGNNTLKHPAFTGKQNRNDQEES